MWLSLTPIKLGSWWIVWLLTFRSSSHPLNWSSLRYKVLYLCCKIISNIINKLYSFSPLIPISLLYFLTYLQGLRSVTQTVGCFVSLYIISPKLTGLTVVVLPCLVGAGALFGSVLRKLSRLAQEQVIPNVVFCIILLTIFVRTAQCLVYGFSFIDMIWDMSKQNRPFFRNLTYCTSSSLNTT